MAMLKKIVVSVFIGVFSLGLAWTPNGWAADKKDDVYLAGAGDLLHIVIWKNDDITGDYLVRPDGKITLPLVGDVVATGMSTDAIAMQISKKLKLFIENPYVTVIVTQTSSNRIYVLGEVQRPGVYPLQERLTVLQALALSGGFTQFAKKDRMSVIRYEGNRQVKYEVNYRDILKDPEKGRNLLLKRGDTLVVP
ncbi:MAG TPA: sugar ABC transporter substrate-binding protein [Proteobacteria bacterium]|nr:sugar ABC transporter substrate-binding protein [Pseudomonadota bacterium]